MEFNDFEFIDYMVNNADLNILDYNKHIKIRQIITC